MATPTPSMVPKKAGVGGVSTPSAHPAQASPTPRSNPSPLAVRHTAAKTPASSQGSKTVGGTPMMHTLSQQGNTSSPSAHMLSFTTPTGLGIDGATPAILNIPTPALGSAAMMPTMSDLGMTSSGSKRNEDEERRTKMRKILKSIGRPAGRIGEEGIARLARRVGFSNDVDSEVLTPAERATKVGNRPIAAAGKTIMVEIDLKNQIPQSVQVFHSAQQKTLEEHSRLAGEVLMRDLLMSEKGVGVALQANLDRFGANLERLARVDRLSSSSLNCFEALTGIYASLARLFEQEVHAVKAMRDGISEKQAEMEVLCKKSGKPLLHARGRLGLELAYWQESRHLEENIGRGTTSEDTSDQSLFTLRIEVEKVQSALHGLYPALRVSDAWLPDPLELTSIDDSAANIPWQDPPPALFTVDVSTEAMAIDGEQKQPDLRFIAKLDPPLVMPFQTAVNVLNAVGSAAPTVTAVPQYLTLLLDSDAAGHAEQSQSPFHTTATQNVLSRQSGEEKTVRHIYTLDSAKPDWALKIEELPFSHPRQLVELLPTLRQWAGFGTLLKGVCTDEETAADNQVNGQAPKAGTASSTIPRGTKSNAATTLSLDDLLSSNHNVEPSNGTATTVPINISTTTLPIPTLSLTFSSPSSSSSASDNVNATVSVQIGPNADVVCSSHESVRMQGPKHDGDDPGEQEAVAEKLARALDRCGELAVWVEWLRTR